MFLQWLMTVRGAIVSQGETRRGDTFTLTTLNVRLRPDGHLAVKAYGRPTSGGRGTYVSFPVPDTPELTAPHHRRSEACQLPVGPSSRPSLIASSPRRANSPAAAGSGERSRPPCGRVGRA